MLYWSPTALSYLPVLLLHGVSLGYLLWHRPKSRQTWLFCGWLGGMTLMVATQCAARVVYAPRLSTYLAWWGGVGGVALALVVSLAVAGALFVWMSWEIRHGAIL